MCNTIYLHGSHRPPPVLRGVGCAVSLCTASGVARKGCCSSSRGSSDRLFRCVIAPRADRVGNYFTEIVAQSALEEMVYIAGKKKAK